MAQLLKIVIGVIAVIVGLNVVNTVFGSGRKVDEPREIRSDRITPPGTELRVGEEAFVPIRDSRNGRDRDGIVAITVTSIEEGDQELYHRTVEDSEGSDIWYVRGTVENVSQEDLGTAVFGWNIVLPNGDPTNMVLFDSVTDPGLGDCETEHFPHYAELGTIIETCEPDAIASGRTPGGARWGPHDTPYFDDPIIWRR
jgi:hypothetical protein